jgi:hypothetical protein
MVGREEYIAIEQRGAAETCQLKLAVERVYTISNKNVLSFTEDQVVKPLTIATIKMRDVSVRNVSRDMDFRGRRGQITRKFTRPSLLAQFKHTNRFPCSGYSRSRDGPTVARTNHDDIVFMSHHGNRPGNAAILFRDLMSKIFALIRKRSLTQRHTALKYGRIVESRSLLI